MTITEFYNTELVDYASYSTLRMIGSAIDGQKNVHRKVLYTILEKNIKNEIKVSQLNSKVAEFSEYLHGDMSSAISKMAQSYTGSNNVPLLKDEGSFGTRFNNEPSAPRYIYTHGTNDLFQMFNKDDNPILEGQTFEGHKIEPKFYLPSLPVLLLNGSEGMGTGFAQKILPRDKVAIKKYLKYFLEDKNKTNKPFNNLPHYDGFNGTVHQGENPNQFIFKGKVEILNSNKVMITELPVGIELKTYVKTLYKLKDSGVIQNFKDLTNKSYKFEITFLRSVLKNLTEEQVLDKLKLVKTVSENYTAIDENLRVKIFENVNDIFHYYIDVKLRYLAKRKDYMIQKLSDDISLDASKYLFIKGITEDTIAVNKRTKDNIISQLDKIDKIIKKDCTYDYLLNMAIHSLTKERMDKLLQDIKDKKERLDNIKKTSTNEMWLEELK